VAKAKEAVVMTGQSKPVVDIGISTSDRKAIAEGLNALLADTYALYQKTHAFHWNVEGPMFQTLHLMFETHYNELWLATDAIAERIRSLGHSVRATYSELSKLTSIPETAGVPEATEMVRLLVEGHQTTTRTARKILPVAEKAGDESTVDLLTQRLQIHEKTAWMLRSLLA
jgi:starvation-inducible DNA-binding protein